MTVDPGAVSPHADVPRPARAVHILLRVFETLCWSAVAVFAAGGVAFVAFGATGTIIETAKVINGSPFAFRGIESVGEGVVEVVLTGVPLSVSWPYLAYVAIAWAAWLLLFTMLGGVVRGHRRGTPLRVVRPAALFVLAGVWTALAFAGPLVIGQVRPRMAEAAGVEIAGATFAYTMTLGDLLAIFAGPLLAVVVGVLSAGSGFRRTAGR